MLNKDLFGNVLPDKTTETPVSVRKNNKIRVFHASWAPISPHEQESTSVQEWDEEGNLHPRVFHVGTPQSVLHRDYVHEYEIDLGHPSVSPIVWGDAPYVLDEDDYAEERMNDYQPGVYHPKVAEFNKNMRGVKEGLFERTPANVISSATRNLVLPYRNRREDAGSVSYVIPKDAIGGSVRYVGVHEGKEFREKHGPPMTAEEKAKQEKP